MKIFNNFVGFRMVHDAFTGLLKNVALPFVEEEKSMFSPELVLPMMCIVMVILLIITYLCMLWHEDLERMNVLSHKIEQCNSAIHLIFNAFRRICDTSIVRIGSEEGNRSLLLAPNRRMLDAVAFDIDSVPAVFKALNCKYLFRCEQSFHLKQANKPAQDVGTRRNKLIRVCRSDGEIVAAAAFINGVRTKVTIIRDSN